MRQDTEKATLLRDDDYGLSTFQSPEKLDILLTREQPDLGQGHDGNDVVARHMAAMMALFDIEFEMEVVQVEMQRREDIKMVRGAS